ncbi:hypothetical protein AMK16_32415 [Streptomyces sp. CB00455]|nr:hypothetical protein AMK16_32415 [Streptomyces sp. CB00455]
MTEVSPEIAEYLNSPHTLTEWVRFYSAFPTVTAAVRAASTGGTVGLADLIRPAEAVEDQDVDDDAQQAEAFALVEGEFGDLDAAGAAEGLAQEDVRPCRDGVRGCQVVGPGPEGGGVDGGYWSTDGFLPEG